MKHILEVVSTADAFTVTINGTVICVSSGIICIYPCFVSFSFLNDLDRICLPDYIPTQQDVLRAYEKTTTIMTTQFTYNGLYYTLVYVIYSPKGDQTGCLSFLCFCVLFRTVHPEDLDLPKRSKIISRVDKIMFILMPLCW